MKKLGLNQQKLAPYMFLAPFIILFLIFSLYPIVLSLVMSFSEWRTGGFKEIVGFANFERYLKPAIEVFSGEFSSDFLFFKASWNTIVLLIFGSLLQHVFAVPLAILLNNKSVKGREAFRTLYFLPNITSAISVTLIFYILLDKNFGIMNWLLSFMNIDPIAWLGHPVAMKASVSIILNWKFIGFYTIVYLAGLQSIPDSYYEAARMDGASTFQQHMRITLPQLVPIFFFAISMSLIFGMQLFDEPYIWSGGYRLLGGADNSLLTNMLYIMTQGFKMGRFGRAAAMSWLTFVEILMLTGVLKIITDKLDYRRDEQ